MRPPCGTCATGLTGQPQIGRRYSMSHPLCLIRGRAMRNEFKPTSATDRLGVRAGYLTRDEGLPTKGGGAIEAGTSAGMVATFAEATRPDGSRDDLYQPGGGLPVAAAYRPSSHRLPHGERGIVTRAEPWTSAKHSSAGSAQHASVDRDRPPAWPTDDRLSEQSAQSTAHRRLGGLTVAQFAAAGLGHKRDLVDFLAELAERIAAHDNVDGFCGCGCNVQGWAEVFPCPIRSFYEAVRDYLSPSAQRFQSNEFGASCRDEQSVPASGQPAQTEPGGAQARRPTTEGSIH
jgi:hypothetical protein